MKIFYNSSKETKEFISICLFVIPVFLLLISGCATLHKPTLAEMNQRDISDFSNDDLKVFLDKAKIGDENNREFWLPMMKKIVNAKNAGEIIQLWVPMDHLKTVINHFNAMNELEFQEKTVYVYYWQIFTDIPTRQQLYGIGPGNDGEAKVYLRQYLPALFERHKYATGEDYMPFTKMYRLVKHHDPDLIKEVFDTDPFSKSFQ